MRVTTAACGMDKGGGVERSASLLGNVGVDRSEQARRRCAHAARCNGAALAELLGGRAAARIVQRTAPCVAWQGQRRRSAACLAAVWNKARGGAVHSINAAHAGTLQRHDIGAVTLPGCTALRRRLRSVQLAVQRATPRRRRPTLIYPCVMA